MTEDHRTTDPALGCDRVPAACDPAPEERDELDDFLGIGAATESPRPIEGVSLPCPGCCPPSRTPRNPAR